MDIFSIDNLGSLKPLLTALLLPPVPFVVLIASGAYLMLSKRLAGWLTIMLSLVCLWLSSTQGLGLLLEELGLQKPYALTVDRQLELKKQNTATTAKRGTMPAKATTAIVILGGGRELFAPEYVSTNLSHASLERLRYGLWLARETNLPVAFTGGIGWADQGKGISEADIAASIATQEFSMPLQWIENAARDTRENAQLTIALLQRAGIKHILLVTHGWHMRRAVLEFTRAAAGSDLSIEAAPMGLARGTENPLLTWIPSNDGITRVRNATRELLGLMAAQSTPATTSNVPHISTEKR